MIQQRLLRWVVIAALFFLSAAVIVVFTHWIPRIESDFAYRAEVDTVDNFYDVAKGEYLGEQRGIALFSQEVQGVNDGVASVETIFDVRTLEGEELFRVENERRVKTRTGGDTEYEGVYLQGPAGGAPKKAIQYYYYSAGSPVRLEFQGSESILGVETHKYVSAEGSILADHTNLVSDPLPFGATGVELESDLSIWIEPISGYLVKQEDAGQYWFVNLSSGERVAPRSYWKNTYSRASVVAHATQAKYYKMRHVSYRLLLPVLVGALLLALACLVARSRALAVAIVVLGVVGSMCIWGYTLLRVGVNNQYRIAVSTWVPYEDTVLEEAIEGFSHGLRNAGYPENDVELTIYTANANPETQYRFAQDVLVTKPDVVFSLTTTGTKIISEVVRDIPVVFSVITYPVEAGIVESLGRSGNNRVGSRTWVPAHRQLDPFLQLAPDVKRIGFIQREGEENSDIQRLEFDVAAREHGVVIVPILVSSIQELESVLPEMIEGGQIDAMYGACDTLIGTQANELIGSWTRAYRIPSFTCNHPGVEAGALLSVAVDFFEAGALAGEKAAAILAGVRPSALETSANQMSSMMINKETAALLNISIPQSLLLKADLYTP